MPRVLTIAGSDPSGGAGVQRDLQVFHTLGVWGLSAITSITAQTATTFEARADVDAGLVAAQIGAAAADGVDAAKTGMLATRAIVEAVVAELATMRIPLVVDPVLASSTGSPLLDDDALEVVRDKLLPLADCVTPNAPEAEILAGVGVNDHDGQHAAARALLDLGAGSVIVTGGHLPGDEVVDLLAYPGGVIELRGPRIRGSAHGTGCTFSAAIVALLALGHDIENAATRAKRIVEEGLTQPAR
jgi:hydroxymethylpyrimidine/phosphomethylpyrimidine kinase